MAPLCVIVGHLEKLRAHFPAAFALAVVDELVVVTVGANHNDGIVLGAERTNARRALRDRKLAEGPLAGEVFCQQAGRFLLGFLQVEHVDRAVVGRNDNRRRRVVEVDAVDFRLIGPSSQFGYLGTAGRIEDPDQRATIARRGQPRTLQIQRDAADGRFVSYNLLRCLLCVRKVNDLNVTRPATRERQQRFVTVWTEHAQTLRVLARLEHVQLRRGLCERVNLDDSLKNHDDPVSPQPDTLNRGVKIQRNGRSLFEVVPHEYFVGGIKRPDAAANEGQVVTAKEHLHVGDSTVREVLSFLFLERIRVVHPEAIVGGAREATLILIKSGVQQPIPIRIIIQQVHFEGMVISLVQLRNLPTQTPVPNFT